MSNLEAFFKACELGDIEKLKHLVKAGNIDLESKTPQGWTGLIMACYNQNFEVVKFLVENGANINATNAKGTNVFMYAKTRVQSNPTKTQILTYLLDHGANINHLDQFDKSVLDYVRENGAVQLALWLEEKGAKSGKELKDL